MRKKKGGNPNAVNSSNSNDFGSLSRSQQDDAIKATLSPNVLANNLVQSLSNCGPAKLSATNGCQDYDFNKMIGDLVENKELDELYEDIMKMGDNEDTIQHLILKLKNQNSLEYELSEGLSADESTEKSL